MTSTPPRVISARDKGLGEALKIQRKYPDPKDWRAAVDRIPVAEVRSVAEDYLSGIVRRIQTLRRMAKADGFDNLSRWREHSRNVGRLRQTLKG